MPTSSVERDVTRFKTMIIRTRWGFDEENNEHYAKLTLPGGGEHEISLHDEGTERIVTTTRFYVEPRLRGYHIGTRLFRAGLALATHYGATCSVSDVESQQALKIRCRIFGDEGMQIYDENDRANPLPITVEQACGSLALMEKIEIDLENREHGFVVVSNLRSLDTSEWYFPAEINVPHPKLLSADGQQLTRDAFGL